MSGRETTQQSDTDKSLRLLVLVAVKGMKLKEQVALMSRAGFDRNEMATLLGTTPNSISVRMAELKGQGKGKLRLGEEG